MAINPTFSSTPTLAKVKLGSQVYWLKDAELRDIVSAFGTATAKDSTDTVTSSGTNLPTESAVYAEIVSQIATLGKVVNLREESDHTKASNPKKGDLVVESDGKEWLYDGNGWREVGDETAYVLKTTSVAGYGLSSDITSAQLSTALDIKAFAHANTGTFTVNDYATGIADADYTPKGNISVALTQTDTAATITSEAYTPAGNISVALTQSDVSASLTTKDYTPAGNVTVLLNQDSVNGVTSVGTLPTYTNGSYTAPSVSESVSSFATAGIIASVGSGNDADTLILSTASTASALTATNFDAGSYTAPTYVSGTLPTISAMTFATGVSSATFAGTKEVDAIVTNVTYEKAAIDASNTKFTGTPEDNLKITSVTYNKATVNASQTTFTGTSAVISHSLTKGDKTVTVNPASN